MTQQRWQATRVSAPSAKVPMEPGSSLRAEIRRLRAEQHVLLQRVDGLIEVLGLDGDILKRLASLGASLHAHKQLDILNGQHSHHLGKVICVASDSLNADCKKRLWTIKKNGDIARHSGFSMDDARACELFDLSADGVLSLLSGMAASPALVAGGCLVSSPEGLPESDSGTSLVTARHEALETIRQDIIQTKVVYAAGLLDTDHPDWGDARPGDKVISKHGGIYEVSRIGYCDFLGKFRLLAPHEDPLIWARGAWRSRMSFRKLSIGSNVLTVREIPLADGRFVLPGMMATVSAIETDRVVLQFWDITL
eukprot:CAMPEP_0168434852 /NCGR_PEP_ID=MMETSP0228-20121227/40117_1 /TAXON_ID=133427 /ORGANISM="Protoceratium reticulatum, Strain CCCM 535 (=CCMP 1889)" /LENGTH=308 /DNA_ID=CAMNT_0008449017 /DNA_START=39 /DNA_END=962 /DNA_ORIENTATION=-